jgi:hypothetical protein
MKSDGSSVVTRARVIGRRRPGMWSVQTVLDTAPQLVDHLMADAADYPASEHLSVLISTP